MFSLIKRPKIVPFEVGFYLRWIHYVIFMLGEKKRQEFSQTVIMTSIAIDILFYDFYSSDFSILFQFWKKTLACTKEYFQQSSSHQHSICLSSTYLPVKNNHSLLSPPSELLDLLKESRRLYLGIYAVSHIAKDNLPFRVHEI